MQRPGRLLLGSAIVAAAYVVAGKLGLALAVVHSSATAVWAPTGIGIAALLCLGYRAWPAIFVAAFVVNVTTPGSVWSSLGIASGNTLESVVGCWLVLRFAPACPAFRRPADVFAFTLLAALLSPVVSATVGVTSLALAEEALWSDVAAIWSTWWLGDATGALIVAPPLLLWVSGRAGPWLPRHQWLEGLVLLLVIVVVGRTVFSDWLPASFQRLEFLAIPALVWVAFRFGPRQASAATLLLSAIALMGTMEGVGPFSGKSNAALLALQAYMAVITLMTIVLATAVDERRRTESALLAEASERLRAHEALQQSEQLHRAIAELASDFAVIARVEADGAVALESATDGFRRVTGYAPDELVGPSAWRRLLADRVAAGLQDVGRRLLRAERVSLELPIVDKSGAERWLRCHAESFRTTQDRGVRILGAAEDITERRNQESALQRHQQMIRQLSTPVLRIRDRLLLLPVIGEVDEARSQHIATELLRSIRTHRARVVVVDMTGVAAMTTGAAQHFLNTIEACRLLGSSILLTGMSHATADVLISFGDGLGKVTSRGDLQSGMEEAERLLGSDSARDGANASRRNGR